MFMRKHLVKPTSKYCHILNTKQLKFYLGMVNIHIHINTITVIMTEFIKERCPLDI